MRSKADLIWKRRSKKKAELSLRAPAIEKGEPRGAAFIKGETRNDGAREGHKHPCLLPEGARERRIPVLASDIQSCVDS